MLTTSAETQRVADRWGHSHQCDPVRRKIEEMASRHKLPPGWEAVQTSSGELYYWNRISDQTQWINPLLSNETCLSILEAYRDCRNNQAPSQRFERWIHQWQTVGEEGPRLDFQVQMLSNLLGMKAVPSKPAPSQEKERRRAVDGRWFFVERMPADNSCGFHAIGICRQQAAELLRKNKDDKEVQALVATDLLSALQTGEKQAFPASIRNDVRLWNNLSNFYTAQQTLDQKRRETKDFLTSIQSATLVNRIPKLCLPEVSAALELVFARLKEGAALQPSGAQKLEALHLLRLCKMQLEELQGAERSSREAFAVLMHRCCEQVDAYVSWIGSDSTFWLSFLRGCGGSDRGGGLLDALAKVGNFCVHVWAEGQGLSQDLELVHEANYGSRVVHLWFRNDLGHFDRLVPCEDE